MKIFTTLLLFLLSLLLLNCNSMDQCKEGDLVFQETDGEQGKALKSDYISPIIGTLKYVPAGQFQRDSIACNFSVISKPYRISQHEITRAQFQAIMGTDKNVTALSIGNTDPVQQVNWYHVIAFCNKLSLAEGLRPVYAVSGVNFETLTFGQIPTGYNDKRNYKWNAVTANWSANGYRLPTEIEWMWAAMGAPADGQVSRTNKTGFLKNFAGSTGSNAVGDFAVYGYYTTETGRTRTERTNPVGTKSANELGLFDMSGNVSEWCWDWHGAYPVGTLKDYRGAASGRLRVVRGGSWSGYALFCTVAYRYGDYPCNQCDIGFRVVRP